MCLPRMDPDDFRDSPFKGKGYHELINKPNHFRVGYSGGSFKYMDHPPAKEVKKPADGVYPINMQNGGENKWRAESKRVMKPAEGYHQEVSECVG